MNSPVPGCITVTDMPGSQKPRLYWVSGLGVKTSGEGHVEISAMPHKPPCSQESRSEPMLHSGVGALRVSDTTKDLKDSRMVIPIISQFKSPLSPLQKLKGFWEVTVDCSMPH